MKTDRRKEFVYRGIQVIPRPPSELLHRHWLVTNRGNYGNLIRVFVDYKADARRVIDAWLGL